MAADYFHDDRLTQEARGGVATKHRHKNQLAIFGQLMATFEYMLKDYVAKAIDATSAFDDKVKAQTWLEVTTDRVLSQRVAQSSIGSMLVHPTLGWHSPETVNERFKNLFNVAPITGAEIGTLSTLWILRHSVAHNAGFITAHDSARIKQPALAGKVAWIEGQFINDTFDFLQVIAERVAATCGKSILKQWFRTVKDYGQDFHRDEVSYGRVKDLATCVVSRTQPLHAVTEAMYQGDWALYAA